MEVPLKLMCVLPHPDDESLGFGGALARYGSEGEQTCLITITRGQHGWFGDEANYPGPDALGRMREEELRAACAVLKVGELTILDYMDGELDQANPGEISAIIAAHIRRFRPHVVASFGSDGIYGHPDHIASCQLTAAAIVRAASPADPHPLLRDLEPHTVPKFYNRVSTLPELEAYEAAFGELVMHIDGVPRGIAPWPEWAATALLDVTPYASLVWQ